jgi:hypothetical protein
MLTLLLKPTERLLNDLYYRLRYFLGGLMDTRPWGSYSVSDYTLEQWHNACLIHHHDGALTTKTQCKLPIKTPDGAVNQNAIFAAAAALSGARTPIDASPEEKAKAARVLVRQYREMDKEPPTSLLKLSGAEAVHTSTPDDILENFIEHYGVKGMQWGVRKPRKTGKQWNEQKKTWNQRRKEKDAQIKRSREKADAIVKKNGRISVNNPDAIMARKMTSGEKATIALMGVIGGSAGVMLRNSRSYYPSRDKFAPKNSQGVYNITSLPKDRTWNRKQRSRTSRDIVRR